MESDTEDPFQLDENGELGPNGDDNIDWQLFDLSDPLDLRNGQCESSDSESDGEDNYVEMAPNGDDSIDWQLFDLSDPLGLRSGECESSDSESDGEEWNVSDSDDVENDKIPQGEFIFLFHPEEFLIS